MHLAIILINYHDYVNKYLPECLASLRQINWLGGEHHFYIVDNDASPSSEDYIKSTMPEVIYLPTPSNLGWGGGNNVGLERAARDGADYFCLLNLDLTVDPSFITEALNIFQADPAIALVQSRLMLHESPELINSLGNDAHYLGFGYCHGYRETFTDEALYREITYPSGAAVFVSRAAYEKIGPFTADFFMYHDDFEWGMKSRLAGFKNVVANRSVVYHKYEFSRWNGKFYWLERNRAILWLVTLKIRTLLLILPAALLMEAGLLLISIKNHWWQHKLKAYLWLLTPANWGKLYDWRRATQKLRTISDHELTKTFCGRIAYQENTLDASWLTRLGNNFFNYYWQVVRHLIIW